MDSQLISVLVSAFFGSGGVFMILTARNKENAAAVKAISEMYAQLVEDTKEKFGKVNELEDKLEKAEREIKELRRNCNNCPNNN